MILELSNFFLDTALQWHELKYIRLHVKRRICINYNYLAITYTIILNKIDYDFFFFLSIIISNHLTILFTIFSKFDHYFVHDKHIIDF